MKRLSLLFFIVSMFIFSRITFTLSQVIPEIQLNELKELVSKPSQPNFHLISVLPSSSYKDCNIPGSINIPIDQLERKSLLLKWHKNDLIIVYGASPSCPLSRYAFERLKKAGFLQVKVFSGGLKQWHNHRLPVNGSCKAGYLKNSANL